MSLFDDTAETVTDVLLSASYSTDHPCSAYPIPSDRPRLGPVDVAGWDDAGNTCTEIRTESDQGIIYVNRTEGAVHPPVRLHALILSPFYSLDDGIFVIVVADDNVGVLPAVFSRRTILIAIVPGMFPYLSSTKIAPNSSPAGGR